VKSARSNLHRIYISLKRTSNFSSSLRISDDLQTKLILVYKSSPENNTKRNHV